MPKRSRLKRNSTAGPITAAARHVAAARAAMAGRRDAARARTVGGERRSAGTARDRRLHLAPIDDQIEHAVLEQELAALESLGQLLPDRLLDDARAGEADERLRLRDVHVAEHREARGHAAGRRIGQDRDVGEPRAIEPRQRAR